MLIIEIGLVRARIAQTYLTGSSSHSPGTIVLEVARVGVVVGVVGVAFCRYRQLDVLNRQPGVCRRVRRHVERESVDRVGRKVLEGPQDRLVGVCWVCRRAVDRQGVGGRVGRAAVDESRSACRSNKSGSVQVLALQFDLPTR